MKILAVIRPDPLPELSIPGGMRRPTVFRNRGPSQSTHAGRIAVMKGKFTGGHWEMSSFDRDEEEQLKDVCESARKAATVSQILRLLTA
ncbi:unnamed protein product [Rodentolepis nana]|uniref:Uncharacterized protein n=1 Tax=Rodentolepis nana TaxID=102285 RepID=A0A3P7T164_RODNA|nr:unnamed protein product [Rodentolepis nana]